MHHPANRDLVELFREEQVYRGLKGRQDQLITSKRAKERFLFQGGDMRRRPCDDSCLWPAQQLIAAEADEVCSRGKRFSRGWLTFISAERAGIKCRPASEILQKGHFRVAREGRDLLR